MIDIKYVADKTIIILILIAIISSFWVTTPLFWGLTYDKVYEYNITNITLAIENELKSLRYFVTFTGAINFHLLLFLSIYFKYKLIYSEITKFQPKKLILNYFLLLIPNTLSLLLFVIWIRIRISLFNNVPFSLPPFDNIEQFLLLLLPIIFSFIELVTFLVIKYGIRFGQKFLKNLFWEKSKAF